MDDNQLRTTIALDLLGLKDEVVRQGKTIRGPQHLLEALEADGPFTELDRIQSGPNSNQNQPVFHHLPYVLKKYRITPRQASETLYLMQGAFSPSQREKLIKPICEVLNVMHEAQKDNNSIEFKQLEWTANPSTLGFIIGELVQKGYINAPKLSSGDINYTALAEQVLVSFCGEPSKVGKQETIRRALNPESDKGLSNTNKDKFRIPFYTEIGNNRTK